jgi:hypothetical protein
MTTSVNADDEALESIAVDGNSTRLILMRT